MMMNNVLKIEDYEQKETGMAFCTKLKPIERLIWLYIQNTIQNKDPTRWSTDSLSLLKEEQIEDDFAYIISRMVNEGWITNDEAFKWGYSLIQKTERYLSL